MAAREPETRRDRDLLVVLDLLAVLRLDRDLDRDALRVLERDLVWEGVRDRVDVREADRDGMVEAKNRALTVAGPSASSPYPPTVSHSR